MAYRSLAIDSHTPSRVRGLISAIENHYFSDVHCMLRLPVPRYRLTAGCNFAVTQVLMAAIAGISVTLYRHSGASGQCFRGVLVDYYPWDVEPNNRVTATEGAQVLYSVIRNPLTHDLGLDLQKKAKTTKVKIKRLSTKNKTQGLPERSFGGLERSDRRLVMSPTVTVRPDATVLLVEALYWGVRVMVERLTRDQARMQAAEAFLAKL
ncbi:MAG: hypothetical protein ACXWCY_26890 [Burkholderiales bacterium]